MLSPLRFHYDSRRLHPADPPRLINSGGTQDLIVNILARNQRYEVANYDNVTIPTNLDVTDATRKAVRRVLRGALRPDRWRKHPRAVVTEYAWASSSLRSLPHAAARAERPRDARRRRAALGRGPRLPGAARPSSRRGPPRR